MVTAASLKRVVMADWVRRFPDLTKVGERRLLRIVGPLLVGIEIVTWPIDSYRPYNVAYPLWRRDLKECLDYPEVSYELVGKNGLQLFVKYEKHEHLFDSTAQSVINDALFPFSGNLSVSSLLAAIERYGQSPLVKAQGDPIRARMLRTMCLCSLYADRIDLAQAFLDTIMIEKEHWDMKRFTPLLGPMDVWIEDIFALIESGPRLHEIVEANLAHKRLSRLTKSTLTPD